MKLKTILPLALAAFAFALPSFGLSVNLTCTDTDPQAIQYHFYRSKTSGGPYAQIDSVTTNTCAYVDSLVAPGDVWYYVADAQNAIGVLSGHSAEVKATIPTPPSVPQGLTAVVKP
jgi:hypothetical protein